MPLDQIDIVGPLYAALTAGFVALLLSFVWAYSLAHQPLRNPRKSQPYPPSQESEILAGMALALIILSAVPPALFGWIGLSGRSAQQQTVVTIVSQRYWKNPTFPGWLPPLQENEQQESTTFQTLIYPLENIPANHTVGLLGVFNTGDVPITIPARTSTCKEAG